MAIILMIISINYHDIIAMQRISYLEYDYQEKEEVGIATKLVKQEKREEREKIILCCADFVGAEFALVLVVVVDMDGSVRLLPLFARLPVFNVLLQPVPPLQRPAPRATCRSVCAITFVTNWKRLFCKHTNQAT